MSAEAWYRENGILSMRKEMDILHHEVQPSCVVGHDQALVYAGLREDTLE